MTFWVLFGVGLVSLGVCCERALVRRPIAAGVACVVAVAAFGGMTLLGGRGA